MTSQDVSVGEEAARLTRLLQRFAALLGIAATVLTPAAFVAIALSYERADLLGAVERRARTISQHVYGTHGMWTFETLRLEKMLTPTASHDTTRFRIEQGDGGRWNQIAAVGPEPARPAIEIAVPIIDGNVTVGRAVGDRSIVPLLLQTGFVALVSGTIGFAIFALISYFSVPVIARSFARLAQRDAELAAHRAGLEQMVSARTSDLASTNARLQSSLVLLADREAENQRLALVAQRVDASVIVMSRSGEIEWVNDAFTRLTGYALAEVLGAKPGRLLRGPQTDPDAIRAMRTAFRDGASFSIEVLLYTKSGASLWSEFDATMVHDSQGKVTSCIAIGRDISARKEQEQRLAEALENERALTQQQRRFVSVVAHEFRTPLTIIDGAAQRILRNAARATPEELRERGEKIRSAVARMGQLIDTTLNAARLESGRIEMNRAETDLAQLLAQACERVRGIAPDFEVRLAGADAPLLVDGDERLLDQVFTNLLTNAVKYSGDSRAIDVSLATQGGRVEVAIRDYGIGIPEDELPQLFTRYFRASTARGIAGTGIGLDLARNLVEMHGGEVAVASRIGEGSTFTVRLDAKPVRVAAA